MTALLKRQEDYSYEQTFNVTSHHDLDVKTAIEQSWKVIAPYWPLQNLIAVNPLRGLEEMPFEQALIEGKVLYQQPSIPKPMEEINRQTIKWCQIFFDNGQATISMPLRHLGMYSAWRQLAPFDSQLHYGDSKKKQWLNKLPESAEETIQECLDALKISPQQYSLFFKLILTSLPGWAAHIQFRTEWAGDDHHFPVSKEDYLAVRLVITTLLWSDANEIIEWNYSAKETAEKSISPIENMAVEEKQYRKPLLKELCNRSPNIKQKEQPPMAQLVFCIDVRSEPFRRAIEAQGDYETFGFAGFFGVPVRIHNETSQFSYDSCPVLLKPKHEVQQCVSCSNNAQQSIKQYEKFKNLLKKLYQSVKYGFSTPCALVETLGPWNGIWMGLRTFFPRQINRLLQYFTTQSQTEDCFVPNINSIPETDQCLYAEGALRAMGLTKHFAPIVVFCGHGSKTQNNAFASGLDCGACGGNHGGENARILALILNQNYVREYLEKQGIVIPTQTRFVAAEHITTTDEVHLYPVENQDQSLAQHINKLKNDLSEARKINNNFRVAQMGITTFDIDSNSVTDYKSMDWAEVRPEWGLSRNASFIAAPRSLSQDLDLEGRAFLHSYDWKEDHKGNILTTILTAPMVVAQWINSQYLFSTLDNVAYGSGSKITKNITGKIGIMQGNASDLMTGLPLQTVFRSDNEPYHQPLRLMTVIYAPLERISNVISQQPILQTLAGNGWITLVCIDPNDHQAYELQRDFKWEQLHVQDQSPYVDCEVVLTTKHHKSKAVAPSFQSLLSASVIEQQVDTDIFGTFSGEIARTENALECVRRKCEWGLKQTMADYGLASEGSFGPHPDNPFSVCNQEILYFIDQKRDIHLHLTLMSEQTNYQKQTVQSLEDLYAFAKKALFPSHALILRPNVWINKSIVFKGIQSEEDLEKAYFASVSNSVDGKAWVETDMRAHVNPTRMNLISKLAEQMAHRLVSLCPSCQSPGWGVVRWEHGLECEQCGMKTNQIKAEIYGCTKCNCENISFQTQNDQKANAAFCHYCNP